MHLSELTAYAEEKYHIREEHKWADFPGFSVLTDPRTGKWVAMLIRQWDSEAGEERECCDLKCGRQTLREEPASYLCAPFRMSGPKWIGVRFDESTEAEVVFRLFDRAYHSGDQRGFTVELQNASGAGENVFTETKISFDTGMNAFTETKVPFGERKDIHKGMKIPAFGERNDHEEGKSSSGAEAGGYGQTELSPSDERKQTASKGQPAWMIRIPLSGGQEKANVYSGEFKIPEVPIRPQEPVPEPILKMKQLYEYRGSSFQRKCRNFYRQGMFMKDYEDDYPLPGNIVFFFPTYHDFSDRQLRGYFAWRTGVRKGEYRPIGASFAYMYLYELLNGIGTSSVEESLRKMKEWEEGYLDAGYGDSTMRNNLHGWMRELAVLRDVPPGMLPQYTGEDLFLRDRTIGVLRNPSGHTEEEVFSSLLAIGGKKPEWSFAVQKEAERGKKLYFKAWQQLTENCRKDGKDFFALCFGEPVQRPWFPMANAVYYPGDNRDDRDYVVNECCRYECKNGAWRVRRYENLYFQKKLFQGVLHEAERLFRRYLKTGRYLKEQPGLEWAAPYIEAAIREEEKEREEAARPVITLDLSGLDRIREDAQITQERLLVEEEEELFSSRMEGVQIPGGKIGNKAEEAGAMQEKSAEEHEAKRQTPDHYMTQEQIEEDDRIEEWASDRHMTNEPATEDSQSPAVACLDEENSQSPAVACLDEEKTRILRKLLKGEDIRDDLKAALIMPSIFADEVNEALWDEIGDNVLEWEEDSLLVVEDYREDLEILLGGRNG